MQGFLGLRLTDQSGWLFYLGTLGWGLGWPLLALGLVGLVGAGRTEIVTTGSNRVRSYDPEGKLLWMVDKAAATLLSRAEERRSA